MNAEETAAYAIDVALRHAHALPAANRRGAEQRASRARACYQGAMYHSAASLALDSLRCSVGITHVDYVAVRDAHALALDESLQAVSPRGDTRSAS